MTLSKLRRKGRTQRESVFLKLLLSFFVVLLLPIVVGTVIYIGMEKGMVENAKRFNLALLEQVRESVDHQMTELNQMTSQVAFNPKLINELNAGSDEVTQAYRYIELISSFPGYKSSNSFIEDFYVYFNDSQILVSPRMKTDLHTLFDSIYHYKDFSFEQFKSTVINGYHYRTFLPSLPVQTQSGTKNLLTFVQSLPIGERANMKATLVILIDEQQIRNLLNEIYTANQGTVYILNEKLDLMMSTGEDRGELKQIKDKFDQNKGSFTFENNNQNMIVSYTTSSLNGWKFITAAPTNVVLSNVNTVKQWALFILLLSILAGVVVSYYLASRNYNPIKEVVTVLLNQKKNRDTPIYNEIEFIKRSIHASIEEENQLRSLLDQQLPVIRANFLNRLVKGRIGESASTDDSLQFMNLYFPLERFSVIIAQIDDCSGFRKSDTEHEWALVRSIVSNVSLEVLHCQGYAVDLEKDRLAILVNTRDDSAEFVSHISLNALQLAEILLERFKMNVTFTVSNVHPGLKEIGRAYEEAEMALDYRMTKGQRPVIFYEDIKDTKLHYHYYPLEMEGQLINFAKSGDEANVIKLLDHLYELNFRDRGITLDMGKCLFIDLLSTAMKLLHALRYRDDSLLDQRFDPVKFIESCSTAEQMLTGTKELFQQICKRMKEEKTDHNERLYNQILSYIDEHLHEGGLSLTAIADSLDLNASYLSAFFKRYSGLNLSDYIASSRMEKAKQLLASSSHTILQIALLVGYANDVGFIRVFKKIEGITPGKYRESINKSVNPKNG